MACDLMPRPSCEARPGNLELELSRPRPQHPQLASRARPSNPAIIYSWCYGLSGSGHLGSKGGTAAGDGIT